MLSEWNDVRSAFPYFRERPDEIYFDSASTSQKPRPVIQAVESALRSSFNAGRASYRGAREATQGVEVVREKVRRFLNASPGDLICFTSGATESLRLAQELIEPLLPPDVEVIVGRNDHRAALDPWYRLERAGRCRIQAVGVRGLGATDRADLFCHVGPKTAVVVLTHIHNVFGGKTTIEEITPELKSLVVVDASQSVGHCPVDVSRLGAHVLAFSAHKMFGPTGLGVLWMKEEVARDAEREAHVQNLQESIERGTQNLAGIAGLGAAIDFISAIGPAKMEQRLEHLTQLLISELRQVPGLSFLPGPAFCGCPWGFGIVSFQHPEASAEDIGFYLAEQNICVRAGAHCTAATLGNSVRFSLHVYNTEDEISRVVQRLRQGLG